MAQKNLQAAKLSPTFALSVQQGSEELKGCVANLQAIWKGIAAYKEEHGDEPDWLSDLFPKYLADEKLLLCPADDTGGTPKSFNPTPMVEPKMPCSYCYEFNANTEGIDVLHPEKGATDMGASTWKEAKHKQREIYGDIVPIVRCWHHFRKGDGWINLSYAGEIYQDVGGRWEAETEVFRKARQERRERATKPEHPAEEVEVKKAETIDTGDYIIADFGRGMLGRKPGAIWKVTPDGDISLIARDASMRTPHSIAIDKNGDFIVTNEQFTSALFRITPGGDMETIVKGDVLSKHPIFGLLGIAVDSNGDYIVCNPKSSDTGAIIKVTPDGKITTTIGESFFRHPDKIAIDSSGNYIVTDPRLCIVAKVSTTGEITTIASGAPLEKPTGVAIFSSGDYIVVDSQVHAIFKITPAGNVDTIVKGDSTFAPMDIAIDSFGNFIIVEGGHGKRRICKVDSDGEITTIVSGALLVNPLGIAIVP